MTKRAFVPAVAILGFGLALNTSAAAAPDLTAANTPVIAQASPSAYNAVVLSDNPLAYWSLDETDGVTVDDVSTYAYPITLSGAVSQVAPGVIASGADRAMAFDGETAFLRTAKPLSVGTDFTIEAWAKAPSDAPGGTVVSLYTGNSTLSVELQGNQYIGTADMSANWPAYSVFGPGVNLPNWHHLVLTLKGGTALALYVDGAAAGSASIPSRESFSASAVIGWSDAAWMGHYKGMIDDVALYSGALTPDRVQAHFAAAGCPCAGAAPTFLDAAQAELQ